MRLGKLCIATITAVLCWAYFGELTQLQAQEFQITPLLPKTREALVKLSVGELAAAVIDAEHSLMRNVQDHQDLGCALPPMMKDVETEWTQCEEKAKKIKVLVEKREELLSEHLRLSQDKLTLEAIIAANRRDKASARLAEEIAKDIEGGRSGSFLSRNAAVAEDIAKDLEGRIRIAQMGSLAQEEARERALAAKAKQAEKQAQIDIQRTALAQVDAELAGIQSAINGIQVRLAQELRVRDKEFMTLYQRAIAYGTARGEDSFAQLLQAAVGDPEAYNNTSHVGPHLRVRQRRASADFWFGERMYDISDHSLITMKSELVNVTARGDVDGARRLLNAGADLYVPPGSWSALALAKTFDERTIWAAEANHRAVEQVPWAPNKKKRPQEMLSMLSDQFARVQKFLSTERTTSGDREHLDYYGQVLHYWRCRIDGLDRYVRSEKPL